jgi:hypothetical protein
MTPRKLKISLEIKKKLSKKFILYNAQWPVACNNETSQESQEIIFIKMLLIGI